MKITQSAQEALHHFFKENNADGLLVEMQETCCGKSPVFALARFDDNDQPEMVDGIALVASEELKPIIEPLIIDLVDGELVVIGQPDDACGCSGCSGCGH